MKKIKVDYYRMLMAIRCRIYYFHDFYLLKLWGADPTYITAFQYVYALNYYLNIGKALMNWRRFSQMLILGSLKRLLFYPAFLGMLNIFVLNSQIWDMGYGII
jgi:hypothetical protein